MLRYFLAIPGKQIVPLSGERITIGQAPADFVRHHSITRVPTAIVYGEQVQLYLFSSEVAPQHASLTLQSDGSYAVEDERSQIGTYLNDEPLHSQMTLKQGDRLNIGPYEFFVICESGSAIEPQSEDENIQLISCRWCGHELLSTEEKCPQCGDLAPASREELGEKASSSGNNQGGDDEGQPVWDRIAALHRTPDPTKTSKRYCASCHNWVLAVEQRIQNNLHGPIVFLLCWPWFFVWIVLKMFPSYRCLNCERVTSFSDAVPLRWLNGRRIVFGSFCVLVGALLIPTAFETQREQQATRLFRQGLDLLDEERHEEALAKFNRVIDLVPNSPRAYFNRGLIHSRLGNDQQAIDDFTAAIEYDTEEALTPDALHQRAHSYDRLGKTEAALEEYTRSIDLEPGRAEFRACRGRFHARQNSVDDAITDFREALRLDPANPDHWQLLGFTLFVNERHEQALHIFTEAIESGRSRPAAYLHRGYARMALEQHDLAATDLEEFLKFSPDHPDALRELGRCHLILESNKKALEHLNAAIEAYASDPDTYYLRAVAHAELGHREQALEDVNRAISLVDPSADSYEMYSQFRKALQAEEEPLPGWRLPSVL